MSTVSTLAVRSPWLPCDMAGWRQGCAKLFFQIELGRMLQNEPATAHDVEVPYLKAQHVQWGRVVINDLPTMWAPPKEIEALRVCIGDLLVCEGGDVGRAAMVQHSPPENCIIQNAIHRVRGKDGNDVRLLGYILRHAADHGWFDVLCNRATIAHFTVEKFGEIYIALPSVSQQRAIADYLDRETARIDALITAKERVLRLLAEKRRALITRTVTRGLDPRAPLRDSGIPWLGEIPAHWSTPPVYSRFEVQLGKMLDEKQIKRTHLAPYLRNVDVQWGSINSADLPEMDFDYDDRARYALSVGDILVCEGGEIGRCAIWDGALDECYYQKALHRLRPLSEADDARFFIFVMRTIVEVGVFSAHAAAATIQHLPAEKLRVVRYPSPPISEQLAIVSHIVAHTTKLDMLSSATERSIKLLKERRAALIAEAVTGKIDVREAIA